MGGVPLTMGEKNYGQVPPTPNPVVMRKCLSPLNVILELHKISIVLGLLGLSYLSLSVSLSLSVCVCVRARARAKVCSCACMHRIN